MPDRGPTYARSVGIGLTVVLVSLLSNPGSPPLAASSSAAAEPAALERPGSTPTPGEPWWVPGASRTPSGMDRLERRILLARAGVFTFALAFGVLLLGGGRELLAPRRATLLAALLGALAVYVVRARDPILGLRLGMTVIAGVALLHAAQAAAARHAPSAKWRLMLATSALVGTAGVALAAFGR